MKYKTLEFIFRASMKGNELGIALGICGLGQFERVQTRSPYPEGHNFRLSHVQVLLLAYYAIKPWILPLSLAATKGTCFLKCYKYKWIFVLAKVINGSTVFFKYTNVHKVSSSSCIIFIFIFAILGYTAVMFLGFQSRPFENSWL